jgi:hypothetical protein
VVAVGYVEQQLVENTTGIALRDTAAVVSRTRRKKRLQGPNET